MHYHFKFKNTIVLHGKGVNFFSFIPYFFILFLGMVQILGWECFISDSHPIYSHLVHLFYANMDYKQLSLQTLLKGKYITTSTSTICMILNLKNK